MNKISKFFTVVLMLIVAGMVSSCSNDANISGEPEVPEAAGSLRFLKAPDVKVYSGSPNNDLMGGSRADGDLEEAVDTEDRTGWPEGFEPARENVYNKGHVKGQDEVEVNLAVNQLHQYEVKDEAGEATGTLQQLNDLTTKLSVHVRYPHDVKVRIPVPAEYLVPVDDMAIVLKHQEDALKYKDAPAEHSVTMNVGGNEVSLHVALYETADQEGVDFAEKNTESYQKGYICIWTEGIDEDVIAYCQENYQDGITFEVWNYFNLGVALDDDGNPMVDEEDNIRYEANNMLKEDDLFGFINSSSVEFSIDQNADKTMPDAYVNAFFAHESTSNGLAEGMRKDAFVYITGDGALNDYVNSSQRLNYPEGYKTSYHLNGKAFNHIYKRSVGSADEDVE